MNDIREQISDQIRRLRREQRLTLHELQAKTGIHYTMIFKYEHGRSRIPADLMPVLAKALKVSLAELYGFKRT